jgi:tRNA-2-methylthio-N6-dimethylallyladenosine synthase
MKFFIETIGCQMNVCDSDAVSLSLSSCGAVKTNFLSEADVVILNTCSVRAQAEQKAFSWLGRAEELKSSKKDLKVVVIGCMAQRLGDKIKKRFKSADLIIGAKNIDEAAKQILQLAEFRVQSSDTAKAASLPYPNSELCTLNSVVIMRGCDNYCSYCVVPYVRGKEISLNFEDIIRDCLSRVKGGAKELTLLGQNVNSYNYNGVNFSQLLKKTAAIDGLETLTFMTSHPKDLSDELIDTIAAEPKIKKYIHLPMQSGSDKILNLMNRKYTYAHYKNLIDKLRTKIPDINITTDIIVGFPQETQEDFSQTLQAVKDIKFNALFVFKYSPRPDTKAVQMKDDVPLDEKKRRHNLMLEEAKRNK